MHGKEKAMSTLIREVDARTGLAGTNQMELLLFHLGSGEVFGLNVFKIREVMKLPPLTRVPEADPRIDGVANIRGTTVPVVGLKRILGMGAGEPETDAAKDAGMIVIVTEYNASLQAFRVTGVDRIFRVSWSQVKPPPALIRDTSKGAVTAVTMLDDGRMVLILDVEKILTEICPRSDDEVYAGVSPTDGLQKKRALFADDSAVARTQIRKTLERIGMSYLQASTGREAWELLLSLAEKAKEEGKSIRDEVHLVVSDIEMPDMDGFTLTKHIRADSRFADIPVVLHSSLTGSCNIEKAKSVGATDFVTKFDPKQLQEIIARNCEKGARKSR
jgi:two-component system chemotaxis response regulator CheV